MSEVLDRPTTVTGRDVWRDEVQATFPDVTPVIRPSVPSESFDALVEAFFVRRAATVVVGGDVRVVVHDASPELRALTGSLTSSDSQAQAVHPATSATAELAGWLQMPLDAVVELAGLASSTRAHWRNNPTAPVRPSKSGRLLRLHTAVGLLVGEQGPDRARATLHAGGWLTKPLDESRLADLEAYVRDVLLPEGLQPPAYLRNDGLTRDQVLARTTAGAPDEARRRLAETPEPIDDASEGS